MERDIENGPLGQEERTKWDWQKHSVSRACFSNHSEVDFLWWTSGKEGGVA